MVRVEEGPCTESPAIWANARSQNASPSQHMIRIPSQQGTTRHVTVKYLACQAQHALCMHAASIRNTRTCALTTYFYYALTFRHAMQCSGDSGGQPVLDRIMCE